MTQRPRRSAPGSGPLSSAATGLVPAWAKDPKIGSRLIDARMETLAEKPAFWWAFAKRRAVIAAVGYYE